MHHDQVSLSQQCKVGITSENQLMSFTISRDYYQTKKEKP